MEKRSLIIIGINLIVLLVYHIIISHLYPRGSAYHAGIQGDTTSLMGLIFMQFVFNIFAFIGGDSGKKQSSYILSAFLVVIIGFGLCNWIAPMRF